MLDAEVDVDVVLVREGVDGWAPEVKDEEAEADSYDARG